ncbi:uncharacterized protein LOC103510509 [Diaphorina citri]|uniref:Uncharacterized protein LOC103510509 n=1 Tax=Diaphorina citri TaxID=121845 RepID=A0A3Q0IVP6_DIACI|nr:uncharacterized protein LOC103510509 [Diaphorina citri]
MLGQCHEGLENKIKAFEEFKVSLSLNLNNKNVLKKLATLAIDNDVPLDLVKDKYWIERIEQHLATQPAERFKLKEKLVKMSQGNENYSKQYEELLKAELEANPQSLDVHLKLLRLYKTSGRIMGAYVLTMNKTKKKWTQEYVWYNEIVDICQQYEAYQAKANLWGDEGKTKFYENYLHNVEKEIKFAYQRKGKEVADLEKSLSLFDEVLYKYRSSVPNFDQSASLSEKLIMQHYSAQLCFYSLLLLLKKTQPVNHPGSVLDHALVSNPDSFKEKLSGCVPPLLLALNPGLVLEFDPKSHGTSGPDNIDEMKAETNYRISQCSLFLGMLKKYGFVYGTELSHPYSLHHMVWLGVSLMLGSDSSLPPPSFKATQVASKIQFAARNIHLTHMNLCSLDVDAFLYASGKEIFNTDIYVKLAEDELYNASSAADSSILNSSLLSLNGGRGEGPSPSHKYFLFLQKAKESLVGAQARLDSELNAPSYYPDLGARILDLLSDVEMKLETTDGADQSTLNLSGSSFVTQRGQADLSVRTEYARIRHNNSTRLYFSPEPSNLNSMLLSNHSASNKALEAQVELILERLKRLQDQFERAERPEPGSSHELARSVAGLNERLDGMAGQLNEMHEKYLSILESIKDLVQDKTDVIKNITENLSSLATKVDILMGQDDLEDNYQDLLNPEDYPEISPAFYSGLQSAGGGKATSGMASVGMSAGPGFYGAGALTFSEGQTLPNFYNQQILPPGVSVPPAVQPATIKPIPTGPPPQLSSTTPTSSNATKIPPRLATCSNL